MPEFGRALLHAIRREELQDFLDRKALELSSSVVSHLRWFLNAIFKLALSDGARTEQSGGRAEDSKKMSAGPSDASADRRGGNHIYLEVFDLREKLIARLAIFEGIRPGRDSGPSVEVASQGRCICVEERVYKRRLQHPEERQDPRRRDLRRNTRAVQRVGRSGPGPDLRTGFVFPSEKLTTPLSLDNLWRRYMQPKLEKIGLEWATFQVLRKTNASLSKEGRRRSESRLRPAGPRARRQPGGLHELRPGAEASSTSDKLEAAVLRKPQPETGRA